MNMKSTKISDYMITQVVSVEPDTDLFKAIGMMLDHKVSSMPVLDPKGHVVGMLSQWQCLTHILGGSYSDEIGGQVKDLMDPDVHIISPSDDVVDVTAFMTEHGCHKSLPVVESGALVGTISCPDLLKVLFEFDIHKAA
jgi:CBS domain-containing protein